MRSEAATEWRFYAPEQMFPLASPQRARLPTRCEVLGGESAVTSSLVAVCATNHEVTGRFLSWRSGNTALFRSGSLPSSGSRRTRSHARPQRPSLHQIHRGVYAVGHTALSRQGRCMAASPQLRRWRHAQPPFGRLALGSRRDGGRRSSKSPRRAQGRRAMRFGCTAPRHSPTRTGARPKASQSLRSQEPSSTSPHSILVSLAEPWRAPSGSACST